MACLRTAFYAFAGGKTAERKEEKIGREKERKKKKKKENK
jgi:hypothetical protein